MRLCRFASAWLAFSLTARQLEHPATNPYPDHRLPCKDSLDPKGWPLDPATLITGPHDERERERECVYYTFLATQG